MRHCECGNTIPRSVIIDGKARNLKNRSKCLQCLPFGESRYKKKTSDEIRSAAADKARRYYNRKKEQLGIDPINALRNIRRIFFLRLVDSKCQFCGYAKLTSNLAFHHIENKELRLSSREFQFGIKQILQELKKCVVCCHNCHGEIHDGLINQDVVLEKRVQFSALIPQANNWFDLGLVLSSIPAQ